MHTTPLAERLHIVFWGLRNAGKSSLMNNLFGRPVAIVSAVPGTTTDTVTKAYELLPLGPVAVTDTPGLDDEGHLGSLRVQAAQEKIRGAGVFVLVTRKDQPLHPLEQEKLEELTKTGKPVVVVLTHADQISGEDKLSSGILRGLPSALVDNLSGKGVEEFKKILVAAAGGAAPEMTPVEGLVRENDLVVLVTPIDLAAPKGRLILPQVETIRDLLDRDCGVMITKERELGWFLGQLKSPPKLVICDSQAFSKTAAELPEHQLLTSFSILFARKKSDFPYLVRSLAALKNVPGGIKVLVLEACSHHQQADDLGTVRIPRLFQTLVQPQSTFLHARKLPPEDQLKDIGLIISCGACMVTRDALTASLEVPRTLNIPVLNYGLFLAWANGLLPRALEPFPEEHRIYLSLGM